MKIAVPYENGNVFPHFGRTQTFRYYEVEDGRITPGEILGTDGVGHEALADLLAEKGVELIICGGLGTGAMNALNAAGIRVVSSASGSADDAVRAYVNGELSNAGVNCDHHHEKGRGGSAEKSGSCGEDGGGCCGEESGGCGGRCPHHAAPIEGKNVGKTVRVHYEGTFDDGSKFDSSYDRGEPLEFQCGAGQMIRGFDQAVARMNEGETVKIHLMPEEAYGEWNPRAVLHFKISELPGSEDLMVGQKVRLMEDSGRMVDVRVTERGEDSITLDANHEMAGKELNFKIELIEVQ